MRVDNSTTQNYERLSSMQKINSASDNPANSAISEKMENQAEGLKQGTENTENMQNVVKTAEGALDSVQNQLQRMRELTLQASNGTLAQSDKESIQSEVDELKESINDQTSNTEFNNQKLVDGSFQNKQVASNSDGSGGQVSVEEVSTSSLGVEDLDVTQNADVSQIDDALDEVSSMRSELGSNYNRMEYSADINRMNRADTIRSNSNIRDANAAEEISDLRRNQIMEQYKYFSQSEEMNQEQNILNVIS
ncbi:MAG: flagellin [Halanaerobacter sp.]